MPIRKRFRDAGSLHSQLNLYGFWDESAFVTKSGDVGVVLKVAGVDYESLDHAMRDHAVKRLEAALRTLDENVRVYQILTKTNRPDMAAAMGDTTRGVNAEQPNYRLTPPSLSDRAAQHRARYIEARAVQLYQLDIHYVLVREGGHRGKRSSLAALLRMPTDLVGSVRELAAAWSSDQATLLLEDEIERDIADLKHKAESLCRQLEDLTPVTILSAPDAFRVLYRLVNFDRTKRRYARLISSAGLDYQLADSEIEAHRSHLAIDDELVRVFTVKEPPSETWPLILRELLETRANFTAVSEWKAIDSGRARKLIQSRRRHFHNSKTSLLSTLSVQDQKGPTDELVDDSKCAAISELGECLTAVSHDGKYFGEWSLSIVASSGDLAELDKTASAIARAFTKYDGAITQERWNLLNAFFATVPANHAHNLRRLYLLNTNYADLSFLFTVHTGNEQNRHLGAEYLAVLETDQATPFYLNLHHEDVAHTLILGATGSGKSFLLNFLIQNLQKYRPQTYIFDLGRSFENLTRIFSGTSLDLGVEHPSFTINPFALPLTRANLNFLYAFVKVLIEAGGKYELSSADERTLYTAIERLYKLDPKTRTLSNLAAMVGPLGERLERWARSGQFGHVFDNVEDSLTLASFQTFNFDQMSSYPDLVEPLLFYILHRASAQIEDPAAAAQFKVFVVDEAWTFIRNRTIRDYVTRAEKTWRKKNAAMILATQSLHELAASEMLEIVAESCPTKIFLSNPDLDPGLYRDAFHLNDTELEMVSSLAAKRELVVKTPASAKKLHLNVDSFAYWMATNTPRDNVIRNTCLDRYGIEEGLERLAAEHPIETRLF